jgi:gluconate 2-dehydrogenase gamma chain
VPVFLDRALHGAYGTADGTYQRGPFRQGSPEQGYQLPAEPAGFYRVGIADADAWCRSQRGGAFADLSADDRQAALKAMQSGEASFATLPSAMFFGTYWFDVMAGYFSDPIYGGNRDMAAWRMLGYPGTNPDLRRYVGVREPIAPEPASLLQLTREG